VPEPDPEAYEPDMVLSLGTRGARRLGFGFEFGNIDGNSSCGWLGATMF
jgi:hypothetical protein